MLANSLAARRRSVAGWPQKWQCSCGWLQLLLAGWLRCLKPIGNTENGVRKLAQWRLLKKKKKAAQQWRQLKYYGSEKTGGLCSAASTKQRENNGDLMAAGENGEADWLRK